MGKRVRRQHTVSRFYLEGFANSAQQIGRVSTVDDQEIRLSITDATIIKDFYTLTLPDGTQTDFFERVFAYMEGPASAALRAIVEGQWPITGEARLAWSTWMALQYLRGEEIRDRQQEMNAQMIRLLVGVSGKQALRTRIEQAEGRTVSDEELDEQWRDLTKPEGPDLAPDGRQHMRVLTDLLPPTAAYIRDSQWVLHRFHRRVLLTSDHPVSLLVRPGHPVYDGVGLATATAFLVPLSRRLGLIVQPRHHMFPEVRHLPDFVHPGSTKMARVMNQEAAARARRYLYHHPDDAPLEGLHLPQPETENLITGVPEGLIREEGLFHGLNDSQCRALSDGPPRDRSRPGMTINDMPWPIPGRKDPL